jgi:peptidoglycan/LPS O-acetylase OafA/YrhL
MDYRRDIDGLRAVAVLAIMFFHAGFSFFPGGYLGVDVFFVISGYLITGIIFREQAAGTFSLSGFWERRARRILPALIVMLLITSALAYWLMLPFELRVFAQTLTAVILFSSNILFWIRAGFFDFYFDPPAQLNPLLHTWSLGVEEQFYLVFPVLMAVLWRYGRRWVLPVLTVTALVSFAYSNLLHGEWPFTLGVSTDREANFYLLPTRAWQLLLGAVIAWWTASRRRASSPPALWQHMAALSGLGLVLWAIYAFEASAIQFPALFALAPTVGTALVLVFGRGTLAGALLSATPLVAVGLISYSAYLWHQPFFAFAHYVSLTTDFGTGRKVALILASLAAAWASWHWIETPFRNRATVSRRTLIAGSVGASVALITFGAFLALSDVLPTRGRLLPGQLLETSRDRVAVMNTCGFRAGETLGCALGPDASAPPAFLVVGDSHGAALLPAFQAFSHEREEAGRLVVLAGCMPLVVRFRTADSRCEPMQTAVLEFVASHEIKRVVLVSRWAWYPEQDMQHTRPAIVEGLRRTVEAYRTLGVHVTIVEQVPQQTYRPVGIYVQAPFWNDPMAFIRRVSVTRQQHDARQATANTLFAAYRGDSHVRFVDPATVLCDETVCAAGTARESFYWDESHLSRAGAVRIGQAITDAMGVR